MPQGVGKETGVGAKSTLLHLFCVLMLLLVIDNTRVWGVYATLEIILQAPWVGLRRWDFRNFENILDINNLSY